MKMWKRSYPGFRRGGLRFRQGPHNSETYTNLHEQRPLSMGSKRGPRKSFSDGEEVATQSKRRLEQKKQKRRATLQQKVEADRSARLAKRRKRETKVPENQRNVEPCNDKKRKADANVYRELDSIRVIPAQRGQPDEPNDQATDDPTSIAYMKINDLSRIIRGSWN
ncbi:hypothetical protein TNIN_383671 [Trichonephila inaurata madagascariensis]|uniref:Uncharacterized protein n=1 Tax=Trichonephila inaurata madagascariensis TaxID=2747483 RepID=A0A8X6XNB6_9ARAC|nr:hypothetical protein TNIN_383671 [Trichonephila inaurata madagascariensis]